MTGNAEQALPAEGTVRLTIAPLSDFYAEDDERAAAELFELQEAIKRELPEKLEVRTAPGKKGIITDLIITLGSSGAITALVEVFKSWLGKRPENRIINLQFEIGQSEQGTRSGMLRLEATNVESSVLANISSEALKRGADSA